jgi:heme a synthase
LSCSIRIQELFMQIFYRRLIAFTVVLTLALIMLGAYVRLADAGLGCPDWPGCYGHLTPTSAQAKIAGAVAEQGGEHGPVSMAKAWKEMGHRYVAMFLGALIVGIAWLAVAYRHSLKQSPILPLVLVGVVIMQGLFGKWTVTMLLKPAIVTGHLIGGMLTFSLLVWLWQRQYAGRRYLDAEPLHGLRAPALIGAVLVSAQIVLGGWVSTNYAALACTDLPLCQGALVPEMNFSDGFHVFRELGKTDTGALLPLTALTAIHWLHRIGAILVTIYIAWLTPRVARAGERVLGRAIGMMLLVQLTLGLANVWFSLPLPVAVLHNGGAAVLLGLMVVLNFRTRRARLAI